VLSDLLAGPADLRRLARKHRITLEELVRLLASPETSTALRVFTLAGDATAAIAIGRARISAIAALRAISRDTENPESARKACVDLIKTAPAPLASPHHPHPDSAPTGRLDAATEDLILQALAALAPQPPEDEA
jgi:hypothetical protein